MLKENYNYEKWYIFLLEMFIKQIITVIISILDF